MKWLALALLATLAGACSNSQPQIPQLTTQVNQVWSPSASAWEERLTVFVQVTNGDGLEVLDRIQIVNDEDRLVFTLDKSNWTKVERTGETWFGANNLRVPDGYVSSGDWRVLVSTRAGLQVEAPFVIPPLAPNTSSSARSALQFNKPADLEKPFTFTGFPKDVLIWALGEQGEVLGQFKTANNSFLLAQVVPFRTLQGRVKSLVLYSYDKTRGQGVEAGPFEVK